MSVEKVNRLVSAPPVNLDVFIDDGCIIIIH